MKIEEVIKRIKEKKNNNIDLSFSLEKDEDCKTKITDEDIIIISEELKNNKSIKHLNLQGNAISCKGANALAEMLKVNKTIKDIIVNNNNIGNNGALDFADVLKVNNTLSSFDISNNNIGEREVL